jgi:hypothetical protein
MKRLLSKETLQNEETARWNRRVIAARASKRRSLDQQNVREDAKAAHYTYHCLHCQDNVVD